MDDAGTPPRVRYVDAPVHRAPCAQQHDEEKRRTVHRNHVYVFDVAAAPWAALDDLDVVRSALRDLVADAGLHPVGSEAVHRFAPQGLSLAILLAESHVAVHTWPEHGTAYVTLTTCRRPSDGFVDRTRTALGDALGGVVVARTMADA